MLGAVRLLVAVAFITWLYKKMTCGICKSSRHMVGKTVIVTGGNSGIGFQTAKDLAARGARVILACRNEGLGIAARDEIEDVTGNPDVHYRYLDLASLQSVRHFANEIIKNEKHVDILVNNAGCYGSNETTEDGLLLGMQTNHFGPFLLTNLLLPILKCSAPSRIVIVSSDLHVLGIINIGSLNVKYHSVNVLNELKMYSNAKLCNILMTLELDRRLKGAGVTVNALHPGVVVTGLGRNNWLLGSFLRCLKPFWKTAREGAQTSIHLAVAPEVAATSGRYFRDCKEVKTAKQAQDIELARRLWEESEKLVKLNVK